MIFRQDDSGLYVADIGFSHIYYCCLYSSIAHAVFTFREPDFAAEQSWDGYNYSFIWNRARGTVTFDHNERQAALAFRNEDSARLRLYESNPTYYAETLFEAAPWPIQRLGSGNALKYLYDTINGSTRPVATSVMWLYNDRLYCADEPGTLGKNGSDRFLELFLCSVDPGKDMMNQEISALKHFWSGYYGLSPEEIDLIDFLFACKIGLSRKYKDNPTYLLLLNGKNPGHREGMEVLGELGLL